MLCSKCGQKISEGAKFCPYCGEKCEKQNLDREPIDREEESRRILSTLLRSEFITATVPLQIMFR